MSQRRFGHVPPVQYPVAGQDQNSNLARRPSFQSGDDGAGLLDPNRPQGTDGRGEDELFMSSMSAQQQRPTYSGGGSVSGYGQRYQAQPSGQQSPPTPSTTYNPQHFARSHSTSLPYHPASRYASPAALPQTSYTPQPSSYTPPTYDPSAYASVTIPPQRQPTYHGYNNYGSPVATPYGQTPYSPTQAQSPQIAQLSGAQSVYAASLPSPQFSTASSSSAVSPPSGYDPTFANQSGNYFTPGSYSSNGATSPQGPPYMASAAQAPYPAYSQIPVGPNYSAADPNAYNMRSSSSQASSGPSTPSHPPAMSPGLARHPTNAPLPIRPMHDVPEEADWDPSVPDDMEDEHNAQESLMNDIVGELGGTGSIHRRRPINGNISDDDLDRLRRYDSPASTVQSGPDGQSVSRYASNASNASTLNRNHDRSTYDWVDDESDQEGAAGLALMEQDEMNDRRFTVGGPTSYPTSHPAVSALPSLPTPVEEQQGSDSDFAGGMDLGLFSGGYAGNLTYGNEIGSPPATALSHQDHERPLPPTPRDENEQHPPYPTDDDSSGGDYAAMDYGGTGGLQAPGSHRLSFDEGDERVSLHSRQSGSESPTKEDFPDMFYHPGLSNRPLPALPPGSDSSSLLSVQSPTKQAPQHSHSLSGTTYRTDNSDVYPGQLTVQQQVERSISLSSHSNTPQVVVPGRSRTDAAEERKRALKHLQQQQGTLYEGYDTSTGTPTSANYDAITLPTGRRKKFVPAKLTSHDIRRCAEPWALSSIAEWIREQAEGEPDLKRKTIEEGLIKLFSSKVATMNIADAETLSALVVERLFDNGILVEEEEWVKFGPGAISGVLWQLTGSGCYAPKVHNTEISGRCYSYHCTRTLKKANLDELMSEESVKKVDWATFYKITEAMLEGKSKYEKEKQNILHETVTGEEDFMSQLDVLRLLYRDQLRAWQPPIIPPAKLESFIDRVFGKVDAVQKVNKEHLLAQMKYRQNEQGPWIVGFSDILREWIRKARTAYLEYSTSFPLAQYAIRKEAQRNVLFSQFLEHVRNHKRSERLGWDTFLKAPITRLQRYSLLMTSILKQMKTDSEEKTNLIKAIEEVKAVTMECDEAVDRSKKKVELASLQQTLILRPGFQSVLNLDHLGRQMIMRGDLSRMGSKGVRWVDTHAVLLDHYFILSKAISSKDGRGEKKYDVSKEPIPMPLLFLESMNDDPISRQKGITAPLGRTAVANASGTQLNKVTSNGDRPMLEHAATNSSMGSLTTITRLTPGNAADPEGKILYPFRVKHLGHEVYTLFATTPQIRQDWVDNIIEAKTQHARALHAQNAEPFRLRVLADSAFSYDSISSLGKTTGVSIRGTPLDRAIREMETVYGPGRGPPPVSRAAVNCAAAFSAFGKSVIAIGTDYGVFISDASNPRGWTRSVQISRVTQIAILEEFSVCLLIADKSLIAYPLDVVAPVSNFPAPSHDNPRRAPQRLAKDVAFFATARMKERMLVFFKRKEGMHTTFKVLEPVFQKASERRPRIFGGRKGGAGSTEAFRDFDEFYLPAECYSINLFQTYIAVATAKGFEMLTLDKKQTMSVPSGLNQATIANIANRIRDQRPLGMFRLNDQEFILAYEDCAVYVDKHGEVSRTLIMEYSGKQKKARGATMFGQYLLLFNEDYVEVRNAENGRLRQIIAGRDVKCLDYGLRGPTGGVTTGVYAATGGVGAAATPMMGQDSKGTVKICMTHPEIPGTQIVLEMLLNDGHDKAT